MHLAIVSRKITYKNLKCGGKVEKSWALFPFPPTSHELHFFSVTSGFTRLSMETKYVCRGLISLYVNFQNNPIKWSTN